MQFSGCITASLWLTKARSESMYSSITVANFFIAKGLKEKIPLTPMKLLKLIYLAHGWYLGNHEKPLIYDEIQAWRHGPVIPVIYHAVEHIGPNPLKTYIRSPYRAGREELLPDDIQRFLNRVWENYRDWSSSELSHLTHRVGAPWDQARQKHPDVQHDVPLPNESIQAYYARESGDITAA